MEEKKGRNISVWLSAADLKAMQTMAETRGDTISGLLRAAAQRLETVGTPAAPVDLTPVLRAQGQALASMEERLVARLDQVAEIAGRAAQEATLETLRAAENKLRAAGAGGR